MLLIGVLKKLGLGESVYMDSYDYLSFFELCVFLSVFLFICRLRFHIARVSNSKNIIC